MALPCTRDQALELLQKYVKTKSLQHHSFAVEAAMRHFAQLNGEDVEYWGMVGLLHDLDYELHPEEHCQHTPGMLREAGFDEDFIRSVLSHGYGLCTDVEPVHIMEKVIYTVDELTGFITAVALVRPSKSLMDLTVKSVKKKWKTDNFAAKVDRALIQKGCDLLGLPLEEVIDSTIKGLIPASEALGLAVL